MREFTTTMNGYLVRYYITKGGYYYVDHGRGIKIRTTKEDYERTLRFKK